MPEWARPSAVERAWRVVFSWGGITRPGMPPTSRAWQMACDKPSSQAAGDTTSGKGSAQRVGVHAASPRGGSRIQLQLTMDTDDGRENTGPDIAALKKGSKRIEHLGLT